MRCWPWREAYSTAVSYTHLDVYKRQDGIVSVEVRLSDGFVCLNIENPIRDEEIEVESYGIGVKASEQMIEKMGGSFTYESHDYRSVSYTHLDV